MPDPTPVPAGEPWGAPADHALVERLRRAAVARVGPGADDATLRGGAYSNLRWVPRSDYVGHQVGPIVAVTFERVDTHVPSISAFVRAGYYTHHGTRQDELTVLGGLSVDYDFGALR